MEWCRLYARMPRDPKIRRAGPMAGWLFVVGMCHVTEQETDGFIGAEDVPTFAIPRVDRLIEVLVREGLWLAVDGGWQISRWQDRQEAAEVMQRRRELGRKRQEKYRRKTVGDALRDAVVTRTEEEEEVENPPTPQGCDRHSRPKRWCEDCQTPPPALEPPCGQCGPNRMVDHGDYAARCPRCHPLRSEAS